MTQVRGKQTIIHITVKILAKSIFNLFNKHKLVITINPTNGMLKTPKAAKNPIQSIYPALIFPKLEIAIEII